MTAIEELLYSFIPTDNRELIEALGNISEVHTYKRKEHIYKIGDVQSKVYLLLDGILRCYVIDNTRTDLTDSFMTGRWMAINSVDFFIEGNKIPSFVGMEALTESNILEIEAEPLLEILKQWPDLTRLYAYCLQQALKFQNEINYKRLYLSGKERYQWFHERWPEVDKIASNRQIATFLGIRSEYLSRLRHPKKK